MFSKTLEHPSQSRSPQTGEVLGKSVLAPDLHIAGEIFSTSTVEILGKVQGKITAKSLIIGTEGRIEGTILADSVELRGQFDGTIVTKGLSLSASSDVQADVRYTTVSIALGAAVEGKFEMIKP